MLEELIMNYIQCKKANDEVGMKRIERQASAVGMDKYTLLTVVSELEKEM